MSWNDTFERGLNLFRQGKYEEALIEFNEAILENSKEKSVYDSRADFFEELDRPVDAPTDSKTVIDLAPGLWERYTRSARLFIQIKQPEASLKMAGLALERLKGSDEKRRFEFDALKQQALKDLEPPPCFFSEIPTEICSDIFVFVADESSADTLALTHVCRSWREITLNMPSLWQRLVLTQETSGKKVDAWLQRSKGTLTSLEICKGFDFDEQPNILRYASDCFWAKLESLKVHLPREIGSLSLALPSGALPQLQLQAFEVDFSDESAFEFAETYLGDLDLTHLSSLELWSVGWIGDSWECLLPCTHLRTLQIEADMLMPWDILPVLAQNPFLEILLIASSETLSQEPTEIPELIELVHLRHLCLRVPQSTTVYFRCLRFPNLEGLNIICGGSEDDDRRYLDVLVGQSLPNLTSLRLSFCGLECPDVLVTLLRSKLWLECFIFKQCLKAEAVNTVLTALAEPAPISSFQERSETNEQSVCCPRLQYLDLTGSTDLKAGPIMQLVKAHLPPADVPSEGDAGSDLPSASTGIVPLSLQLPIQTLILDDCESFDTSALPWLRANVPRVSFKMTPQVKEAKEVYYSRYTFWM
ncbi:hypothetical protein DFH11DRAFT_1515178 [Phellopilus nigrolimitatus]|nr:hypothetical protein DFH11DRAFT_1515178 [Phellopilus nigrolimitatus]